MKLEIGLGVWRPANGEQALILAVTISFALVLQSIGGASRRVSDEFSAKPPARMIALSYRAIPKRY
jgi:hypothetical protein